MATDCMTARTGSGISDREIERLIRAKKELARQTSEGEPLGASANLLARVADSLSEASARLRGATQRAEGIADRLLGTQPECDDDAGAAEPGPTGVVDYLHRRAMDVHREIHALEQELARLDCL